MKRTYGKESRAGKRAITKCFAAHAAVQNRQFASASMKASAYTEVSALPPARNARKVLAAT
jgi:hypothetical protein